MNLNIPNGNKYIQIHESEDPWTELTRRNV